MSWNPCGTAVLQLPEPSLDLCLSMLASLCSGGVLLEVLFLFRAFWSVLAMIQLRLVLSLQRLNAALDGFNERTPLNSSVMVVGLPSPSSISPPHNGF